MPLFWLFLFVANFQPAVTENVGVDYSLLDVLFDGRIRTCKKIKGSTTILIKTPFEAGTLYFKGYASFVVSALTSKTFPDVQFVLTP